MLTAEILRERVHYDPDSGDFRWFPLPSSAPGATRWNPRYAGKIARRIAHHGYRQISIGRRHYYAHRLAFLYMTGEWPRGGVDHKDGDTGNNRFDNLRIATQTQNNGNAKKHITNTSGYKGVSIHRCTGKWQARIKINGKTLWLGTFECPKEAGDAYLRAAHEHFGEFARAA